MRTLSYTLIACFLFPFVPTQAQDPFGTPVQSRNDFITAGNIEIRIQGDWFGLDNLDISLVGAGNEYRIEIPEQGLEFDGHLTLSEAGFVLSYDLTLNGTYLSGTVLFPLYRTGEGEESENRVTIARFGEFQIYLTLERSPPANH